MRKWFGLTAFGVALFVALWHLSNVLSVARLALGMLSFFIIGLCLAFILNVPMRSIERRVLGPLNRRLGERWARFRRPVALVLTLVLFVAVVATVVFMVIPELVRTFSALAAEVPAFLDRASVWLEGLGVVGQDFASQLEALPVNWEELGQAAIHLLQNGAGAFLTGTVSAATSIVSRIVNVVVGVILSAYVLFSKERLGRQSRQLLYAYVPERRADWIVGVARQAERVFSNFISGQFTESLILGSLFFIGMTIFGFPYAPMVAVLVGVTAFIPIFGAFIGAAVGAFMILVNQGLLRAVWFLLFYIVLQQLEGNLIYPHVVGKKVMLPGLWVLVAVTLGGNLAGIMGMLVGVPICALLYALLRDASAKRNLARGINIDEK